MQSWEESDGTIDIGQDLPKLASECGLTVEYFRPLARLGPAGSLEWRWLTQFFQSYLPKLVKAGLLGAEELDAYRQEWDQRADEGTSYCFTPIMVDAVFPKS